MKNVIKLETSISLDFFRGISAQLVLIGHLLGFYGWQSHYNIPIIQNFGVLVFFILSGFLIVKTTMLKGNDYEFKNYLIDRFSRIFFTFIPAIIFISIIDLFLKKIGHYNFNYNSSFFNFISNILQLQGFPLINTIGIEAFGSARPFWTVSVEWWIYITFGYIYYFLWLKNKTNLFYLSLFLFSLPVAFIYINYRGEGLTIIWFLGFLLALLDNSFSIKINTKYFFVIIIILIFGILYRTWLYPKMYDLGIALFFATLVFLFFNIPDEIKKNILSKKFSNFSKFIASYSYSLYLVHYSLIELFLVFFKTRSIQNFILVFVTINLISYFFYYFFEKNNSKFRFFLKQKFMLPK